MSFIICSGIVFIFYLHALITGNPMEGIAKKIEELESKKEENVKDWGMLLVRSLTYLVLMIYSVVMYFIIIFSSFSISGIITIVSILALTEVCGALLLNIFNKKKNKEVNKKKVRLLSFLRGSFIGYVIFVILFL